MKATARESRGQEDGRELGQLRVRRRAARSVESPRTTTSSDPGAEDRVERVLVALGVV
jgi:hypothetical protein